METFKCRQLQPVKPAELRVRAARAGAGDGRPLQPGAPGQVRGRLGAGADATFASCRGGLCPPPGPPPPSSGVPPDKWVLAGAGVGVRIVPPPRETRLRPRPGVRCGLSTVRPCMGRGGIGCGVEAAGVLGEQAGAGDIPVTDDH